MNQRQGTKEGDARRRIAVVGARSFLGRNVIALLEDDDKVERLLAIDDEPTTPSPRGGSERVASVVTDLTAPGAESKLAATLESERIDTVVHVGFLDAPSHASAFAHELESVGTMRLVRALRRSSVKKLVLWSQTLLYGANPHNPNFLREDAELAAPRGEPWFGDKIEAEQEVARFRGDHPEVTVTVLRTAPILGPTIDNLVTRYLGRRIVPTLLGFDPLVQLLHEVDAIGALKWAAFRNVPGVFNIVGDGVLPLSVAIRLAARRPLPLPRSVAARIGSALWATQLGDAPHGFLGFLRYVCIADGQKARAAGYRPTFSTREAILDFVGAQRLRDVNLLGPSSTPRAP